MKLIAAEQKGAHSHIENKDFFFSSWLFEAQSKQKIKNGKLFLIIFPSQKCFEYFFSFRARREYDWRYHETQPMTCNNNKLLLFASVCVCVCTIYARIKGWGGEQKNKNWIINDWA